MSWIFFVTLPDHRTYPLMFWTRSGELSDFDVVGVYEQILAEELGLTK